jgi:hypothetical protein
MTPKRHDHGNKAAPDANKIINTQSTINILLTIYSDDFIRSESIEMLQADIVALEHRQKTLECEILEASRNLQSNEQFIHYLKSRALFVREQIEILRQQANASYH